MTIVAKLGSSSLVDRAGVIDDARLAAIAADVVACRSAGHDVVLVSSGAIAAGLGVLSRDRRPTELPALQAASAIGQGALFARWSAAFALHGLVAAQVLLTMHDAADRASWINARATLGQLIAWGAVPIINENDTVATDEITFGDNDTLAAQVAVSIGAAHLVLLTDTDGLYTEHPSSSGAERIEEVHDHSLLGRIDTAVPGSHWGSGGMRSKVIAAEMASIGGCVTTIASSAEPQVLARTIADERVGTRVHVRVGTSGRRGASYKLWLRYAKPARGSVVVDDGAAAALTQRGSSLLPVGITGVDGEFHAGDAIEVRMVGNARVGATDVAIDDATNGDSGNDGAVIAKGIAEFGASELRRLIESGATRGERAAIHRDRLVLVTD